MKALTLLYHDVVEASAWNTSGFVSADANLYKLDTTHFAAHLDAIADVLRSAPVTAAQLRQQPAASAVLLAFDDGGVSAWQHIAPMLEQRGWRGHFFISTNWIGQPGFLSADQIRDLHHRGHIIGSHSCSHPPRMSALAAHDIRREWSESAAVLAAILEQPVWSASVPAGYNSDTVTREAAAVGYTALFDSEPVIRMRRIEGCDLFGRYSVQQATPSATAAALAAGHWQPRARQFGYWQFKKLLKRVGGDAWLRFRKEWLARK